MSNNRQATIASNLVEFERFESFTTGTELSIVKRRTENVAFMVLVQKFAVDDVISTIEPGRADGTLLGKQRYEAMLRLGTVLMQQKRLLPGRTVHRQRNDRVKGKVTLGLVNTPMSRPYIFGDLHDRRRIRPIDE